MIKVGNVMKEKLNYVHVIFLFYLTQSNVFMFSVPRIVAENMGTNGWIALIICSIIAVFNIFLYFVVYKIGKGQSVFEILERSISKALLYPFYFAVSIFWIALGTFVGKQYINVLQIITFSTTDSLFIYLFYAYMLYLILSKSIYVIGKITTLFFISTIWMMGLLVYFVPDWQFSNLTPFIFQSPSESFHLNNWLEVYGGFIGYELVAFLFPYASKDNKLFRGVYLGHILVTMVYLGIVFVAYGFFGLQYLQASLFPLVDMLTYIEFPFINRMENLFLPFFLYKNLMTTVMYCWAALITLKRIFPFFKPKIMEMVITVVSIGFATLPKLLRETQSMVRQTVYIETALAFCLPFILILILYWQKLRNGGETNEE